MSVTDTRETVEPRPTGGVDWAKDDHAVAVVAPDGEQTHRFSIPHDATGLRMMVKRLIKAGVVEVGIERPDGPVVDALRDAGLVVYVIPPGQLKNLRSRYGSAGNEDDRFDAYVLADVVRTDRRRLRPLLIDQPDTTVLRQLTRARKDLVAGSRWPTSSARTCRSATPARSGCSPTSTSRSPCASWNASAARTARTGSRSAAGLRGSATGYCGRATAETLHQRLTGAPRGATGPAGDGAAAVTAAFVATLRTITAQIEVLATRIAEHLDLHPDKEIFTSLPRSGTVRAARLFAEIGDGRGRFPTADSGPTHGPPSSTCRARARGHDHPHAVRVLARAWVGVIWACWTTNTPYDPDRHGALQRVLNDDQPAAA